MSEVTLPHEREVLAIVEAAMNAYEDPNNLILCITDTQEHVRWLIDKLKDATQWDRPTKIYRDGVEVKGGGRVKVVSGSMPEVVRGLRPHKIILFGRLGELYSFLHSMQCPIEAVS